MYDLFLQMFAILTIIFYIYSSSVILYSNWRIYNKDKIDYCSNFKIKLSNQEFKVVTLKSLLCEHFTNTIPSWLTVVE